MQPRNIFVGQRIDMPTNTLNSVNCIKFAHATNFVNILVTLNEQRQYGRNI